MKHLGISQCCVNIYHPESHGMVERFRQILQTVLKGPLWNPMSNWIRVCLSLSLEFVRWSRNPWDAAQIFAHTILCLHHQRHMSTTQTRMKWLYHSSRKRYLNGSGNVALKGSALLEKVNDWNHIIFTHWQNSSCAMWTWRQHTCKLPHSPQKKIYIYILTVLLKHLSSHECTDHITDSW